MRFAVDNHVEFLASRILRQDNCCETDELFWGGGYREAYEAVVAELVSGE